MPETYQVNLTVTVEADSVADVDDESILEAACERVDVLDEPVAFVSGSSTVQTTEPAMGFADAFQLMVDVENALFATVDAANLHPGQREAVLRLASRDLMRAAEEGWRPPETLGASS